MRLTITANKVYQDRDAGLRALDRVTDKLTAEGFTVSWEASE